MKNIVQNVDLFFVLATLKNILKKISTAKSLENRTKIKQGERSAVKCD